MTSSGPMLALALLLTITLMAQEAKVTSLLSKGLAEFPGKEGLMVMVEYPSGASDPVHRHNAHAFVHVLEGSVVMQVKGGKEITLRPGQTFYEGPNDVHVVGRNASSSKPAKFLVLLLKDIRRSGAGTGEVNQQLREVLFAKNSIQEIYKDLYLMFYGARPGA